MFRTLDDLVNSALLPALTGREFTCEQPERMLLSLPVRLGGMAIPMLEKTASDEHMASLRVTEPAVNVIAVKSHECESGNDGNCYRQDPALEAVLTCRGLVRHERCHRSREMANKAECLLGEVSKRQKLLMGSAGEKGVSSWLMADPLTKCGTVLNKSDFHNVVFEV